MKRLNYTISAKETAYGKRRQRLLCWMKESRVSGLSYMPRWIPEGEEPGEMGAWIRAPWLDEPVNINDLINEKLESRKRSRNGVRRRT